MSFFHGAEMVAKMAVVPSLGADIRALRKARKLTLIEMADALGRSVGWLSQVERDKSHPTMADLSRMADLLDVSLSSFRSVGTADGETGLIVRANARRPIGSRAEGMEEELLSPDLTDSFEVILSKFAPHSRLKQPLTRPTQEVCFVVKGSFDICVDGTWFTLNAGDSFSLRGQQFQWANPYTEICEIVWVISPPVY